MQKRTDNSIAPPKERVKQQVCKSPAKSCHRIRHERIIIPIIIFRIFHQFRTASVIALGNLLLNACRPDPSIGWPLRVPRLLWELSIAVVADQAAAAMTNVIDSSSSSTWCLLLSVMTVTTSLTDLFFWAPLFASMTSFRTCPHRSWWDDFMDDRRHYASKKQQACYIDYIRGHGRLLVVVQCVIGGLMYLMTSITAWYAFRMQRDEQKVERELVVLQQSSRWNTAT